MHRTDLLREQIIKQCAAQNLAAARRSGLILKCELEAWKAKHLGGMEKQQIRWEAA